jgi:hypothetical protein
MNIKNMTITFTTDEALEHFHTALCNGLDYISTHGLSLEYEQAHYKQAKENLNKPCFFEDVLIQILKDGHPLVLHDEEEGMDDSTIYIRDVVERMSLVPMRHMMNAINEDDDAETADVIIQTIFYKDIIFG